LCAKACVFDPPRINVVKSKDKDKRKARKCDMCRTRPEGPACVQWCPVRCIGVSCEAAPVPPSGQEG
jgi:Fe-S-cluster-containing hydrogenase component 2